MVNHKVSGESIGKIILIGEHSVVYNEPAIAIPFSSAKIKTEIEASDGDVFLDCFAYNGLLESAPESLLGLKSLIEKVVSTLDESLSNLKIHITSTIPAERGMGSSAAVSAATVRALYTYYNKDLDLETLSEHVNFSEKIVHGNPSGIDTAIVTNNKPLYYIKNEPLKEFDVNIDGYLIVSDTGMSGQTKYAVSKVREFLEDDVLNKDIIRNLGQLVNTAKDNIVNNDAVSLGRTMNAAQGHLKSLGVSNDVIDKLVSVSLDHGALGAKLTGGGLGGCIITLCKDFDSAVLVSKALQKNGAHQTWLMNMREGV